MTHSLNEKASMVLINYEKDKTKTLILFLQVMLFKLYIVCALYQLTEAERLIYAYVNKALIDNGSAPGGGY